MKRNILLLILCGVYLSAMERDTPDFYGTSLVTIDKILNPRKPLSPEYPEADTQKLVAINLAARLKNLSPKARWEAFSHQMAEPIKGASVEKHTIPYKSGITVMDSGDGGMIGHEGNVLGFYEKNWKKQTLPKEVVFTPHKGTTYPRMSPSGKYFFANCNDESYALFERTDDEGVVMRAKLWNTHPAVAAFFDDTSFCIGCGSEIRVGTVKEFTTTLSSMMRVYKHQSEKTYVEEIHAVSPAVIAALFSDRLTVHFFVQNQDDLKKYAECSINRPNVSGKVSALISNPRAPFIAAIYERDFVVYAHKNGAIAQIKLAQNPYEDVMCAAISPKGTYLACIMTRYGGEYWLKVFNPLESTLPFYTQALYGNAPGLVWDISGIHCSQSDTITTFFWDGLAPMLEKFYARLAHKKGDKREIEDGDIDEAKSQKLE